MHRFYCHEIAGDKAVLDAIETHHLFNVLRLGRGESIEIFDGLGRTATGTIESISKKETFIKISAIQIHPVPKSRIILAVSMAKSQRFDFLIEKCTELGADHIAAVQFERTVKQGKRTSLERYAKICISAAKQSGRAFLTRLSGPSSLLKTMELLQKEYPHALWIYGEKNSQIRPFQPKPACCSDSSGGIVAVIGPEGGLTETEQKSLQENDALGVCINPNILRIETAAIAFCSLLAAGWKSLDS